MTKSPQDELPAQAQAAPEQGGTLRALCDCCAQLLALGPPAALREELAAFIERARNAGAPDSTLLADYVDLQRRALEPAANVQESGNPATLQGLPVYTTVADSIEAALMRLLSAESVSALAPDALEQQLQSIEAGINWYELSALLGQLADWFHARSPGVDPSTGLPTGELLEKQLRLELERLQRFGHGFSLALLRVESLASIAEAFGDAAAEKAVHLVARILRGSLRRVDFIGRAQGAGLLVLMPGTEPAEAQALLDDVDALLRRSPFHFAGQRLQVGLAVGVAEASPSDTVREICNRARQAVPAAPMVKP